MADYIRPTPRNPILGLLADAMMGGLSYMEDPRRTQQLRGVGGLLSDTRIPQLVERLAYGEPLTKGKGMTTSLHPDAEAALLTLGPEAVPIGRAAMAAVRATKGLPVGMGIKNVGKIDDLSYRSSHTAPGPDFGAPLYDLTGGGQMYPADVYSAKAVQYYGTGYPKADKEAFALAQRVRGSPDAEITMYRAVPKDEKITAINAGDWVTLSKDYAKTHGESTLGGDYKILSQKVKAKDLWTNADSIHEFGYQPSKNLSLSPDEENRALLEKQLSGLLGL